MVKRIVVAATTTITMATIAAPAPAQSLLDTFHQLRSTVRQLGGKAPPANGVAAAAQVGGTVPTSGAATAAVGDAEVMTPASVLVDDASDSALERVTTTPRRIDTFDVRELRLGMSPREFGRIAERQHFRRRWNSLLETTGTFDLEASRVANFQLNHQIEKSSKTQLKAVQGFDPSGNELKAEFTLEPGGPKLSRITYYAKLNGMTQQQMAEALKRKYGPTLGQQYMPDVLSWAAGPASPSLRAVLGADQVMLTLDQAFAYGEAAKQRLNERAQQMAAARGGGVKF